MGTAKSGAAGGLKNRTAHGRSWTLMGTAKSGAAGGLKNRTAHGRSWTLMGTAKSWIGFVEDPDY
jgi:hypothetical protein